MKLITLGPWTHSYAGATTSFLARTGPIGILLDTGVDPIGQLRVSGVSPTAVTHVFLSHLHSDHSSGFANFVFTRALMGRSSSEKLPPLTVLGSAAVIEGCRALLRIQYPEREFKLEWVDLTASVPFKLAPGIAVSVTENVHAVPCQGCRLSTSEGDIGFQSDSAPADHHAEFFAECYVLVGEAFGTEARVGKQVNARGHSTAEDLGRLVTRCKPKLVIPFHFGPECLERPERQALLLAAKGAGTSLAVDPVESAVLTI